MPNRPVRAIVEHQKPLTFPAKTTVSKAARAMRQTRASAVMVVDHARLVGIFTERDALFRVLAEGRDPQTTLLAEVMTANPHTVHPDQPFRYALVLMYEHGFRHVPVVEDGKPIGIVCASDALNPELVECASDLDAREHIREILM